MAASSDVARQKTGTSGRSWLLLVLVALLLSSVVLSGWLFLEQRQAQGASVQRVAMFAGDTVRGMEQMHSAVGGANPDWVSFLEGLRITLESARSAGSTPVLRKADGLPREVGLKLHTLSYDLDNRYQPSVHRVALGGAQPEDQRRAEHLAKTIQVVGLPGPPRQWGQFVDWLERFEAALPPRFPTSDLHRIAEIMPDETKVIIDPDTFAVIRILGGPSNFDHSKVFVSVFHIPSWSVLNIDQQGRVTYGAVFSPEARELFDSIRGDAELMQRITDVARNARDPVEAGWAVRID